MKSPACPSGDKKVQLFGLLLATNARLARDLGAALEEAVDLSWSDFDTLLRLRQGGDRLKMGEIAEGTVHSTGGTTRLVDRLETKGLVSRENCPTDRRATYVALTALGHTELDRALAIHMGFLERTLSSQLSSAEQDTLRALLEKLN